ncbi:agmatinase family protein [Pseudoflavitalea sp. G-6-1-2]|uniref:agmatinase family protein n=1 Tax=Pseudoflavitalea sp. G-6-1-2 TaxID=2728841 RepID=UPI00146ED57A|nr:agmatinase family protein [Pseudoflavitalea sp. G-6-1-2]NML23715.1 agmatinase family protein [Pseudoflavitalea sp. G-6-1-2]
MTDLSHFDPNGASNPNNNIFGLPFSEEDARLVILPIPWEVTVSYNAGTARAADHIFKASMQVDLFDADCKEAWKQGFHMRSPDRKILLKSDYLRKEAELYIDYTSKGEIVEKNNFMCKSLKEINEGGVYLNNWVYEHTRQLLQQGKLVGLLGGDHSTPLGYFKAIAEKHPDFGILQIDAHCDLRKAYENFKYSHASIMYNALTEIPALSKLVQVGVRDYCQEEWDYLQANKDRVVTFFDKDIKEKLFEGETWKKIADEIVEQLPQQVYVSFDIDGLDPKLCPNTGTPVPGGFEAAHIFYLLKRVIQSGRTIIGFDLSEVGVGDIEWDANVGARVLWKLCNLLTASNS